MPRRLALLLTTLLALLAAAPARAQAATPKDFFGVMVNGPALLPTIDLGAEAQRMRSQGVESWRTEFAWDLIEPRRGVFDWSDPDRRMAAAAHAGIDVLALVVRAPAWANGGSADPFVPPRDPADYAAFVSALIARYGPSGSFWAANPAVPRYAVRAWQIWNEPNLGAYFRAQPFAKPYARLLRAAFRAIRAGDRRAKVVLAGFANFSWRDLPKAYAAGIRRYFDVGAVHPFTGRPSDVIRIIRYNRRAMAKAGDARKPIWLTEMTWSSAQGKKQPLTKGWETTEQGQADRLTAAYRLLVRNRTRLRLGRVYWYTWASDDERGSPNSFDYSGLRKLLPDGRLVDKPARRAFTAVVQRYAR